MKIKEKVEQGKGTADHLMPLGYLLSIGGHGWVSCVCVSCVPTFFMFHDRITSKRFQLASSFGMVFCYDDLFFILVKKINPPP